MSVIVMIPARFGATRLPGKPLLDRTGKPLIQHVVEAARGAKSAARVIVATDDDRIARAVERFGGTAVMTSAACRTGTDRLAEAAGKLGLADDDIVVNVQGDEPEMPPSCIDTLAELLVRSGQPMATLATPLAADQADNPNKVKVVLDKNGRAMYFSRARIPFDRDGTGTARYLLHLGIYAYRAGFLKTFTALAPTPAEQAEKLEQLRALEHGYGIAAAVVDYHGTGIDTPEDYEAFVEKMKNR
ncbi:MAG: 3-deoxy-manno-octulosonate cytidylyltransferase [Phycisphaerae bacterium]